MTQDRAPEPPYYAVIFSAHRTKNDDGYDETAARMQSLAATMPGYLGFESASGGDGFGIAVSYWVSEEAIKNWKQTADHLEAQRRGRTGWYFDYVTRIAKVERSYTMAETMAETKNKQETR